MRVPTLKVVLLHAFTNRGPVKMSTSFVAKETFESVFNPLKLAVAVAITVCAAIAVPSVVFAQAAWALSKPVEFFVPAGTGGGAD
jgi:ABC-type sugar transport system permease subunit